MRPPVTLSPLPWSDVEILKGRFSLESFPTPGQSFSFEPFDVQDVSLSRVVDEFRTLMQPRTPSSPVAPFVSNTCFQI